MKTSYKCNNGHVNKIKRPANGYPDSVECKECNELSYRIMGQFTTHVAEGREGNSQTGYNRTHDYSPNLHTPNNFLYGDAGRYNTQFEPGD